jgi:small subunit ribosomal protein S17
MSEFDETSADSAAASTATDDAPATTTSTTDTTVATLDGASDAVTETASAARSARKVREGNVVSDKMDKTVVVAVIERIRHPKYGKFMMRTKKLYVHDEANDAHVGDKVRVMETRPLSKNKRWRLVEVMERAK